jgi:hypothetical protein
MFTHRAIFLAVSVLACYGAAGQQMYKTVGSDGKVTFSDRPALESAAKLSVMRSNTLRPVKTEPDKPAAPAAAAASRTEEVAPAPEITPQIENAIMAVMTQAEFPRRFYPFCNSTEASARAFNQAGSSWKTRNLEAIEHQRRLLMQVVTPNKRSEMQARVAASINEEMAKVGSQPAPARTKWCAGAVAEMNSEASNIKQPEMMAVVIPSPKRR